MTNSIPSNNGSKAPSASRPFGTKAVSSNSETLKSTSSTYSLGTAESLSSATTGGLFRTNPSPSNTQIPETTATDTSTAAVQPSSSTTKGSIFGTAASYTESGPSQSATGFPGFGTSSSVPRGVFGTNAITSTSHDAARFTNAMPTASNLFDASGETSTSTAFGSASNTEAASTFKPTQSTAPSVLTSADPTPTNSPFPNPFQASYWLNQDNAFVDQSRSPSPAPKQKPCGPEAREAMRKTSSRPATAEAKAKSPAAETQPAATRKDASDETQTGD